jgi:hypothetical protein
MYHEMDAVGRSPAADAVWLESIDTPAFPWFHVELPAPDDKLDNWVREKRDVDVDSLLVAMEGLVGMLVD